MPSLLKLVHRISGCWKTHFPSEFFFLSLPQCLAFGFGYGLQPPSIGLDQKKHFFILSQPTSLDAKGGSANIIHSHHENFCLQLFIYIYCKCIDKFHICYLRLAHARTCTLYPRLPVNRVRKQGQRHLDSALLNCTSGERTTHQGKH